MSRDSVVPIGLMIGGMLIAATSSWKVATSLTEFSAQQRNLELAVTDLKQQLVLAAADRWRRADMIQWVDLLIAKNPSLVVPPVR